jgi:hypothetical protein
LGRLIRANSLIAISHRCSSGRIAEILPSKNAEPCGSVPSA